MAKATIKTIALEAGVSIATVSKALNDMPDVSDAVKARIREIARKQGYTINTAARELASGHSYSVGVILPDIADRGNALIYKALAQRLGRAGYSAYLCDSDGDVRTEAQLATGMLEKRVGVLIVMTATTDIRHVEDAVKGQIPVIFIGGAVNPNAQDSVACDDYKGGMMAARTMFHGGCRRGAVFTWGGAATAQHERSRGFVAYMQEHGAAVKIYHSAAGPEEKTGRELAAQMLEDEKRATGIFATDDMIAIGAMDHLASRGLRVPQDVQMVGYGNTPSAGLEMVRLTSVAPPSGEVGICAGDMALGFLRGDPDVLHHLTLVPTLVHRGSSIRGKAGAGT